MRKRLAEFLWRLGNKLHPTRKAVIEPIVHQHDTLGRLHVLIGKVNGTLHQIPRKYYLWTDWSERPAKLILCEHQRGPREQVTRHAA